MTSRLLTAAGVLLVVGGVSGLTWVMWQLHGTTWVAERRQQDMVEQVEDEWSSGAAGSSDVATDGGVVGAVVRIPRFGADFAVPLLDGTSDDVLAAGFGRDTDGAEPGQRGNLVLVGHRITHGEPLRRMPDLEVGDEVMIETRTATYTYVLDSGGSDLEVPFTAGWVLKERPVNPDEGGVSAPAGLGRLLTLATCAELFATDQRLVVFGHLTDTEQR